MDRRRLATGNTFGANVSKLVGRREPDVARDNGGARETPPRNRETVQGAAVAEPRIERIARRAHELYEARGGTDGRALEDWLQAEREIDAES